MVLKSRDYGSKMSLFKNLSTVVYSVHCYMNIISTGYNNI